ncbi:MAG: hypothetical protein QOG04_2099 [Actinomycetota bacterium]|nr:hypothetical protein [Actinomycetota bacterium]
MARTQIRIRKTRRPRFSALLSALTVLALLVLMAVPAFASSDHGNGNGKDKHEAKSSDHDGDADSDSSTAYTEDSDTNDGGTPNNVSDDGDNRHPSGKDRSVEHGNSGNQGKSESDPDGDSNGGADKPNGSGGLDKADQDGNNGCGNDDDFEDDNNGNCGGHKKDKSKDHESDSDDDDDETTTVDDHKVTICHATGSATNPFVMITPAASGVFHGHLGHQDGRDIVPPFTYNGQTYSQNWDDEGQAMFNNGCEAPAVLPTVEKKVCPADTDHAGEPMANLNNCDDKVEGKIIEKSAPQVAPAVESAPEGAVLPFTGGAIVGYLFAALGLIAAGVVALRAKATN